MHKVAIFAFIFAMGLATPVMAQNSSDVRMEAMKRKMEEIAFEKKVKLVLLEKSSLQEATDCFAAEKVVGLDSSKMNGLMEIKAHADRTVMWHLVRKEISKNDSVELTKLDKNNFCEFISFECGDRNAAENAQKTCRKIYKKAQKKARKMKIESMVTSENAQ